MQSNVLRSVSYRSVRFRSVGLVLAGLFVVAGLAALVAGAQTPAVQPLAAPPGGLDSSKLPDVVGVHLGMTIPQAMAVVKSKYPANLTKLFYTKFRDASDAPWAARAKGQIMGTGNNSANVVDEITIFFSAPPNPQVVVRVDRAVQMIPPTTIGNLEASLVQKYGPPITQKLIGLNLSWEFDEQGKATPVPGSYICTSFNQPASAGDGSPGSVGDLQFGPGMGQPTASDIPRLVNMCPDRITITTLLPPVPSNPNQLVSTLTVSMIDHAEDLRDFIATFEYGEAAAAAVANAAQKKLNQNAAPKL
jgi:hypothetical protein